MANHFPSPPVTLLLADRQEVTRSILASLLTAQGYRVLQAIDGASSIKTIQNNTIDIAIFDHAMVPVDGFEIARYIQGLRLDIPCILTTSEQTSDLLSYARTVGIQHILSKPVDPSRLQILITQILARANKPKPTATYSLVQTVPLSPEELMARSIGLARKNVHSGFGGPFAAVVADANGYLIGEGVNLKSSRFDPISHAEVMAIRKATEMLQQPHLEGCSIYSTSEPTRLARALIDSVGIKNIYFGLRHHEVQELRIQINPADRAPTQTSPNIHRLCSDDVAEMIKSSAGLLLKSKK